MPIQPNQRRQAHLHAQTPLVLPVTLLLAPRHGSQQHRNNARQHGTAGPNSPTRHQYQLQLQCYPPHNRTTLHASKPPLSHLLRLHNRNPLARPLALRPLPEPRHLPRANPRSVLRYSTALLARPSLPARKRHRAPIQPPRLRRRRNSTQGHCAQAEVDGAMQFVS